MAVRSGAIGLALAVILTLGSTAAGGRTAHSARAARPSDLLPKPPSCTAKGAKAEFCILTTVLGGLVVEPHIARPGSIIKARIVNFSCVDLPLTGPCPVRWGPTGRKAVEGSVASWLTPVSRCGKQDHTCRYRVSRRAPTTRYGLLAVSIVRTIAQANGGEFEGQSTDYLGILGPKPPPPLPRPPSGPPQQGPPLVPPPLIPPPHH